MFSPLDTSLIPQRVMTWCLCEEAHFDACRTHGNSTATAGTQLPCPFCLSIEPHLNGTNQNDKIYTTLEIKASCNDSLAQCSLWPNELTFVQGEWQKACTSHACTAAVDALPLCLCCCAESRWRPPSVTHASTIMSSYKTLRKWTVSGHANRNRNSSWNASTWITLLVPLPSSHWSPYGSISSKISKSVVLNNIFKDYVLD